MKQTGTDRHFPHAWLRLFLALLGMLGLLLFATPATQAANPSVIAFQGKVVNADGTNVSNGTYSFVFRLYNSGATNPNTTTCALEGTCLWEETQASVTVASGIFQVELGTSCPFFTSNGCNKSTPIDFNNSSSLYLTMKFNGDSQGYMTPMMHFTSVPYAYNSDKVGGLAASQLARNDASNIFAAAQTIQQSSTTALLVQASASNAVLSVDTSGNHLVLGKPGSSGINVNIVFNNATNSNQVTLGVADGTAAYNLTLPLVAPSTAQCLKSGTSTAGLLEFGSCGSALTEAAQTDGFTIAGGTTSRTLTVTGADITIGSTIKPTSSGTLTIQSNGANNLTLDTGGATVNIATNTSSGSTGVTIGNTTSNPNIAFNGSGTFGTTTGVNTLNGDTSVAGSHTFATGTGTVGLNGDTTVASTKTLTVSKANGILLGSTTAAGGIVFNDGTSNARSVTVFAAAIGATGSYTLSLPTAGSGTVGECLKSGSGTTTTATPLAWGSCGGGSSVTLQASSPGAADTGNINVSGRIISSSLLIQNATSQAGLLFDTSDNILKVYGSSGSSSYVSLSYDTTNSVGIISSSSGVVQVGGGSGNVTVPLTGQNDKFLFTKTYTTAAAYSLTDFDVKRVLTGGANLANGNVFSVQDTSTGSNASSAPNVLYINQNNTTFGGNLILAQTAGTNTKFQVTTAGNTSIAGNFDQSGGSGTFTTGTGAVSLNGNTTVVSGKTLSVLGNNAVTLGSTTAAAGIIFNDGTVNARAVTLTTPGLTGSYSLTLATAGATGTQCVQSTSGSTSSATALQWGACDAVTNLQTAYNGGNGITETAGTGINITSSTNVPTVDQFTIDNTGSTGVATDNKNGAKISYKGGATGSIEAAGMRVDYTPGSGASSVWSGMRIVEATAAGANVTSYGLKLEGAGGGSGTSEAVYVGTGWDIGLDIQSGGIKMAAQSDPAAPAAGNLIIYAKTVAGRTMPKWIGPFGVDTPFQASFGFNRVAMMVPSGLGTAAATTLMTSWGTTITNASTGFTNPAPTSTNLNSSVRKARMTSATNSTSAAVSHTQGQLMAWRGNAAGLGGFFFTTRFSFATLNTNNRAFIGLSDNMTVATGVDPTASTTPGKLGIAIKLSTGNLQWVNNVTGTAPTVTDLGANFPVNTTDLYELIIFSPPNGSSITYRVKDLSTGNVTADTAVSTNIPTNTTFLAPQYWMADNGTTGAVAIDNAGWYLESDN